jgi:uncharacterized DUF497 family protein
MKFNWEEAKNKKLQQERGVSFENIREAIVSGGLLDDIEHPNTERYGHQRIFVIQIDDYVYHVPYVIGEDGTHFLKTVFKNRKARKHYLTPNQS